MPYTTKKQLRATIEERDKQIASLQERVNRYVEAADIIESLGYEEKRYTRNNGREWGRFVPPAGFRAFTTETWAAHQANHAAELVDATEAARRKTLEKVIEAFELGNYGYWAPGGILFAKATDAPNYGTAADRLWADITTALEERAARKTQAARKAAEDRIKRASASATSTPSHSNTFYFAPTVDTNKTFATFATLPDEYRAAKPAPKSTPTPKKTKKKEAAKAKKETSK